MFRALSRACLGSASAFVGEHVRLRCMLFRKSFSVCRLSLLIGPIAIACVACGPSPEANSPYSVGVNNEENIAAYPVAEGQTVYVYLGEEPGEAPKAPVLSAVAEAPKAQGNPFAETRSWSGEYFCPQGTTEMTLRVTGVRGEQIDAVYEFHHEASGASGSYRIQGRFDASTRAVSFAPGAWIERPPNYVTVGMEGRIADDGSLFAGRITHPRCGMFSLTPSDS